MSFVIKFIQFIKYAWNVSNSIEGYYFVKGKGPTEALKKHRLSLSASEFNFAYQVFSGFVTCVSSLSQLFYIPMLVTIFRM